MKFFLVLKLIAYAIPKLIGKSKENEIWGWIALIIVAVVIVAAIVAIVNLIAKHVFDQDEDNRQKYMWITGLICAPLLIVGLTIADIPFNHHQIGKVSHSIGCEEEVEYEVSLQPAESSNDNRSTERDLYQSNPYSTYDNSYPSYNSGDVYVSHTTWHQCSRCGGSGKCQRCNGEGFIYDWGPMSISSKEEYVQRCPVCDGRRVCGVCDGAGGAEY